MVMDFLFGWAIKINPLVGLATITFVLTLLSTLVYKFATDQVAIKKLKDEMNDIKKEMKEASKDPVKMSEIQKRSLEKSMAQFKHSLKPMLITTLPLLLVFVWLKNTYKDLPINFLGIHSWIWIYILLSLIFSIILRKILKVH